MLHNNDFLKFTLKPMNSIHIENLKLINDKKFTLNIDFSSIPMNKFQIPKDIDTYWYRIGCKVSYTALYAFLQKPLPPEIVDNLFNIGKNPNPFLRAFWDILMQMKFILPPNNLLTFISVPKLDIERFFQMITPNDKILFTSVILLIHLIIKDMDYQKQNHIVFQFAKFLIPSPQRLRESQKIDLSILMFAPVYSSLRGDKFWLILRNDLSIAIYKTSDGSPVELYIPKEKYQFNNTQGIITVNEISYIFMTQNGPDIFVDARKNRVSFIFFIQSFKGIERYIFMNLLPEVIHNQFISSLRALGIGFGHAIVQSLVDTSDRKTSLYIFSMLIEAGVFAPFIRSVFMDDVKNIDNPSKLYRNSTLATCASSSIMGSYGSPLMLKIKESINQNMKDVRSKEAIINNKICLHNTMRNVMNLCSDIPLHMNFIFSSVFKSTRRKFTDNLLPAVTVSSIFILRYIMPHLINDPELKECGNFLTKGFLLRKSDPTINDEDLIRETCLFLVNLSNLNSSGFAFEQYDFALICQYLSTNNDKVIENFNRYQQTTTENPVVWSIVEMIENCFVGSDHDYYRVSGNVMSLSIIKSFLISHFLLICISKYVVSIGINNFFQSILPFCKN
ncbi:hypothetical protein TRFO_03373 [Tritrichomonas foetus]|uniref:Ras-GAP domain-containing protein n=1 Tax=Tritrichomonas foetus TaxID=1144522 RepID=A0A1J4KQP4_9EUKA|nr:hypothetical protein TRFO_03373 [Tritrichomonas foetus]|eukprot:OHT13601.1 hypothetical protein TRFO_03373 [Tritrichomonas foetus]